MDAAAKLERHVRGLFPDDFAEVGPYLATFLSLPVGADLQHRVAYLDGDATGLQIFRSVRLYVERLSRHQPLALVFEDLHWCDQSSLDLLEHLLPVVASAPLLLIVMARPERNSPADRFRSIAQAGAATRYSEIVLAPLSGPSSVVLLDGLIAADPKSDRLRPVILERAEGNPFFLEEIIRTLAADGVLEWSASQRRWKVAREVGQLKLPDTLHDVIAARIDRLDPEVKQLLKVASVIGRSFLHRVLDAASESGPSLAGHLQQLQALELIREKRRLPELEYFFKHALVQEAAYATLLGPRRRELHRRVGECIERLFADRLDDFSSVLAYHYARAEAWPKAQEFLFKAGDRAGQIAADAEALAHYQNAMEAHARAFGDAWDPLQRSTLERKIGEALFRSGDHQRALAYVIGAKARLHRPLTAVPRSAWGIRLAIGMEIVARTGRSVLARFFTPGTAESVDVRVLDEIARLGEVTGWIDYFLNPERFFLQALTGLRYFEEHPHAVGLIYNHMSIGLICDVIPAFGVAERHHRQALAIATENGQPIALGHAHLGTGIHAHCLGRLRTALDHYEQSAAIFHGIGHIRGWGGATMMRAWAYEGLGDFQRALSHADAVRAVGDQSSDPQVRAWGLLRHAVSCRCIGRTAEAIGNLETAIELAKQIPDYAGVVQSVALLGVCHLERGDRARGRTLVDEAHRVRRERKLRGMWVAYSFIAEAELSMAELDTPGGDGRAARSRAARACRDAIRQGRTSRHWLPAALRLRGSLAWREGRAAAAERSWRQSIEAAESIGAQYELGLSAAEIGRCLRDPHELERAARLFRESGAAADLARVKPLLRSPLDDITATGNQ
jgi:tetratricopeptide (TPR) repeat protein